MPKQLPLRTLVADDHRLFRQGLISLMNARPDRVTVVVEAEHGSEAVEMCERLRPDLVKDFAYRIDNSAWMYVLTGLIAVIITLFTISFQSIKAAIANPIHSLRSE